MSAARARQRRRRVSISALAALAGVLALLAMPAPPAWYSAAAVTAALCVACARFAPRLLLPTMLAAAAFLWTAWHAQKVLEHRWPAHAATERVIAVATIESIPVRDASGSRFDASLVIERGSVRGPLRARMLWPSGSEPRAGERWRLIAVLHPPRGRVNAFGRDGERQLFRDRVHALGRVVPSRLNERLSTGHRPIEQLRERIMRRIDSGVADRDAAALIAALAVGHTGEMSQEQWRVFNATGTAHLVAISGLHVTLFAVVAIALGRVGWSLLAARLRMPARESCAAVFGLAAATGYSVLAGFSVPTQRTLVMLAAWFAARIVARHVTLGMPISAALVAVLALDPFAPLDAGFWLSFLAMGAIILATATRVSRGGRLAEALRVQCAVALVLAPATLAWFGGVSLAGVVVNLIAIPIVSFVFVPIILLAVAVMPSASLSGALLVAAAQIYRSLWPWLAASADAPHALLWGSPGAWWLVCAAMSALVAVLPWPPALRIACVAWLLPLAVADRSPPEGELEMTMLDTGSNAAVVARTATGVLVRGIGEGFGTDGRSVENALLPFLRAHGLARIDVLILDRANGHAMAGLNALLANIDVQRILVSRSEVALAGASSCLPGERWLQDGVEVHVRTGDCELQMSLGRMRFELLRNRVIVARDGQPGVRPDIAVVAGRATREGRGSPAAERVIATASSGAVTVRVSGSGVEAVREERAKRRIWRVEAPDA